MPIFDLGEWVIALTFDGHTTGYKATESGRRWLAVCSCGYTSATRATETGAVMAVLLHIKKLKADYARNGVSAPDVELGGTLQLGT